MSLAQEKTKQATDILIRVKVRDLKAARRSAIHPIVADVVLEAGGLIVREITVREVGLDSRRRVFIPEVNVFGRTAPVVVLPEKVEQAILSATGDAMARNEQGSVWRVVDGAWIEENPNA